MITVKIPAAIGESSPVIVTDPNGHTLVGVVAMMWDGPWVTIRPTGGEQPPYSVWIPGWVGASVALDISRPTGAAHLAWWLRSAIARISVSSHAEHLAAAGAGQHYSKFLNASSVCTAFWGLVESAALGMPVDDAGLMLLRDYAHRVTGVTNG